ncbi:NB-ARC domain-containing protein [Leptolyngbyaceae cyanobacterium UHCC 1019]
MNVEEALDQVDCLLHAQEGELLNPKRLIFRGAWQDLTYQDMILQWRREYDLSYIKAQGADLCRQLTALLGVKVRKPTFQEDVMEGLERRSRPILEPQPNFTSLNPTFDSRDSVPNIDGMEVRWVGREALVEGLVQRLLGNCRLLMLVGLTGIGKTALAARLLTDRELHPAFPVQKVLSLDRTLPNFENLASEILGATAIADPDLQKNPDRLIAAMVAHLKTQPCLLVLDMMEEILTRDRQGNTSFTDPAFDRFLEQVIRADTMPSRIILTSQERPPSLYQGRYEGRSHLEALLGLQDTEALQLFAEWGVAVIAGSQEEALLQRLIRVYEGHPLALRVIAGEMQATPYDGCVQTYWAEFGAVFLAVEQQQQAEEIEGKSDQSLLASHRPQLQDIVYARIDQAFHRLSQVEPDSYRLLVMAAVYRRAVEPAAWYRLLDDLPPPVAVRSLCALERRYLIEREHHQQHILYRQHSLIRSVALQHLDQMEEESQ